MPDNTNASPTNPDTGRIYRVVLIGLGDIAESGHLPALIQHPRFQLVGVCDPNAERRTKASARAGGVPACAAASEVLERSEVDAVVLALHPEISVDIAIPFLQRGIAVLDEKPLASTLDNSRRLGVAAENSLYQIGFVFRYSDFALETRELISSIGSPLSCVITISEEQIATEHPEHLPKLQGILQHSSAINHEGSHFFDLFRFWKGEGFEFVSAKASAIRTDESFLGPNIWAATLLGNDGSLLQLNIEWLMREASESRLRISGNKGVLEASFSTGRCGVTVEGEKREIQLSSFAQNWERQLDYFASSLDKGEPQGATYADGLAALLAARACEASVSSGESIKLGGY